MKADPSLADDEARLAEFAGALGDGVDEAIAAWVTIAVGERSAGGGRPVPDDTEIAYVIDATRALVMPALRLALEADVDAGASSPLAALRAGVGPMTNLLEQWGVAASPRDAFAVQHLPDDRYSLGPTTFGDIAPELHELGLSWGAARAHVHLRRRRERLRPLRLTVDD